VNRLAGRVTATWAEIPTDFARVQLKDVETQTDKQPTIQYRLNNSTKPNFCKVRISSQRHVSYVPLCNKHDVIHKPKNTEWSEPIRSPRPQLTCTENCTVWMCGFWEMSVNRQTHWQQYFCDPPRHGVYINSNRKGIWLTVQWVKKSPTWTNQSHQIGVGPTRCSRCTVW